jgi:hypothetical protein
MQGKTNSTSATLGLYCWRSQENNNFVFYTLTQHPKHLDIIIQTGLEPVDGVRKQAIKIDPNWTTGRRYVGAVYNDGTIESYYGLNKNSNIPKLSGERYERYPEGDWITDYDLNNLI